MSTPLVLTLRRLASILAPVLLVGTLASACGEDAEPTTTPEQTTVTPSAAESPDAEATPDPEPTQEEEVQRIEVTLEKGTYSPLGERVEVPVGEPVLIEVTADAPGTLHVHATPELEIEFQAGTSEHEVVLDRPGVVEVESHDPTFVLVQLEVR